jgi:preprotein translocase subunit SecD
MGVAATAVRRGRDQVHVHAPALESTATLRTLLTRSAQLTFHEVHPTMSTEEARRGRTPTGYRIYPAPPGELLLHESPVIRGNDLAEAHALIDKRTDEPVLSFRLNSNGTRIFARHTAENIGRPFAIVLDDVVVSAPVIREPILGGSGQVSGNFTVGEANQLAVLLRAGSLPAKLTVLEERVVPARR